MELVLSVDAALDPSLSNGLDHRLHTFQERVRALLVLQAVVEPAHPLAQRLLEHIVGSQRHLVAHQQADPLQLLPLAVEGEQRPDLEEPGSDVEGSGHIGPLAQVLQTRPARNAVVDDEQLPAARFAHMSDRTPAL